METEDRQWTGSPIGKDRWEDTKAEQNFLILTPRRSSGSLELECCTTETAFSSVVAKGGAVSLWVDVAARSFPCRDIKEQAPTVAPGRFQNPFLPAMIMVVSCYVPSNAGVWSFPDS